MEKFTDIDCGGCVGACCRANMAIPLKPAEAALLADAGTIMHQMSREEAQGNRPGWGRKFYRLETNCGNLDPETFECTVYDERPQACRDLQTGSFVCAAAQRRQGVGVDLGLPGFREPQLPEEQPPVEPQE